MRIRSAIPPSPETTAYTDQGGCLTGFLVPPLTVILIGLALAFIWSSSGPVSGTQAATGQTNASLAGVQNSPSYALSPIFPPEIQYWRSSIQTWSAAARLDPNLVATVMLLESCGDPGAQSHAGAMGLFQVMPYHFTASDDPFDPNTNATRGLAYLSRSFQAANGNIGLALAGYNGGIGTINSPQSTWAAETMHYSAWGKAIYTEASSGVSLGANLQAWLAAGGSGFCRKAGTRLGINQ